VNQNKIALAVVALLSTTLSACSTLPGKDGSHTNPLCTLAGAAVGGGGAAAIASAAGPIGAGVLIGAMLGSLACNESAPAATPVAVAAIPPPAAPAPVVAELDSDGDGVMDGADLCPGTPPGTKVDANGCPPILLTLTGVNFKFDSSAIEPASEPILAQAVSALEAAKAVQVTVVGHTDSVGTEDYNAHLAERRANAVVEYLVAHGVAGNRLSAEGRGEREPVQSNDTAAGRYENRRVELHVVGAAAGNGTPQ
jgi:OOP family OmpA-OmpF porin